MSKKFQEKILSKARLACVSVEIFHNKVRVQIIICKNSANKLTARMSLNELNSLLSCVKQQKC